MKEDTERKSIAMQDKETEKPNGEIYVPQAEVMSIEEAVARAEQQVGALKKVKLISLKLTSHQDWVDQEGVPYLTDGGAEKLKPVWGISLNVNEPRKEWFEDDLGKYYAYTAVGTAYSRNLNISVNDIGTCTQRDKFFAKIKGEWRLPSEIDEMNIKKAAFTNCCVRLIVRLLGLRGTIYENLIEAGIDTKKIEKISYEKGSQKTEKTATPKEKETQKELWNLLLQLTGGAEDVARDMLKKYSGFTSKDGKEVEGKTDVKYLTGKWLNFTYKKIKELEEEGSPREPGEEG